MHQKWQILLHWSSRNRLRHSMFTSHLETSWNNGWSIKFDMCCHIIATGSPHIARCLWVRNSWHSGMVDQTLRSPDILRHSSESVHSDHLGSHCNGKIPWSFTTTWDGDTSCRRQKFHMSRNVKASSPSSHCAKPMERRKIEEICRIIQNPHHRHLDTHIQAWRILKAWIQLLWR